MAGISDAARAARAMDELRTRVVDLADPEITDWIGEVEADPMTKSILEAVFSNSPFLTSCALADLAFLKDVLSLGPDTALGPVFAHMKDDLSRSLDQDRLMRELRIARRKVALAVALADITHLWTLERVTQTLTDFADGAVSVAISHLMLQAAEKGDIVLRDSYFPEDDCGYVALAMGKHGARELNYSSDIDLIILYEPMKVDYRGSKSVQEAFIRMTQRLVAILDQRTAEGYVCRVDLRLRPDPGSTPVAMPCAAARAYYDNRGENWERSAMIKARAAAGDLALGRKFLEELTPFVWREHLDFWAIREIQKIKHRIHAQRGGSEIAFFGHNIKLGRGGIREIEFFAQTQQLIFAGRDPYLRCQRTVDALTTLAEAEHIDDAVADELTESYEFLRTLEHRLQMIADQQTQTLPSDEAGMERLAVFMGFDDIGEFRETLLGHLAQVEARFSDLFEDAPDPEDREALDFGSDEPDARTATLLDQFGYRDVPNTYRRLRRWHVGDLAATQEDREKNLLVELVSPLVEKAAKTSEPDRAIEKLDGFFDCLAPGTRTLSLLTANPALLDLVIEIVISAPPLAATLYQRPEQLELAVAPGFFNLLPDRRLMLADSTDVFGQAADLTEMVERASKWAGDQNFQIAANVLHHTLDSSGAGQAFSGIADALCHHIHRRLSGGLEPETGVAGDGMAVVAYGPFGTQELTYRAPLDLLIVCENDGPAMDDPGNLARRFLETMTAPTGAGPLYDASDGANLWGGSGSLVIALDRLADHCAEDAGGSRVLALMQARVVAGPPALAGDVSRKLKDLVVRGVEPGFLGHHATDKRGDGSEGREAPRKWDMRRRRGGLDDLDTMVRILQLRHGSDHPGVLTPSIPEALANISEAGLLDDGLVHDLLGAHHLLRQIENLLAIVVEDRLDVEDGARELKANLSRAAGLESFDQLETALNGKFELVQTTFQDLTGGNGAA